MSTPRWHSEASVPAYDESVARYVLLALVLLLAAGGVLFISFGGSPPDRLEGRLVAQPRPAPAPRVETRSLAPGASALIAGARFEVTVPPRGAWSKFLRPAPRGKRWALATVRVVNVEREHFNPGLIDYLLGSQGRLYGPAKSATIGGSGLGRAAGLPAGGQAVERLAFQVPSGSARPVLRFQPSPTRALEVRVPLGGRSAQ